ncbi:hypothetical protein FB645_000932 [Coemansia sp. IMI 203386]|nr:hypothetical protein FB645_000932 [Coemansia sp. IMI 203386]
MASMDGRTSLLEVSLAIIIDGQYVNNIKRTNIAHRRRRLIRRDCEKGTQEKGTKNKSNSQSDNKAKGQNNEDAKGDGEGDGDVSSSVTEKSSKVSSKTSKKKVEDNSGNEDPSKSSDNAKSQSTSKSSSSSSGEEFKGYLTYYSPSDGACENGEYSESDMVAALNKEQYGDTSSASEYCGKCAKVVGDKGTAVVKIIDACETCDYGALDVSKSAYDIITNDNAKEIDITWTWTDC